LCAEGSKEQIELLQLEESGIRVAEYLVELPSKELLQRKLHKVIELERKRLKIKKNGIASLRTQAHLPVPQAGLQFAPANAKTKNCKRACLFANIFLLTRKQKL